MKPTAVWWRTHRDFLLLSLLTTTLFQKMICSTHLWNLHHIWAAVNLPTACHINEIGCAVKGAVDGGEIPQSRYESYKALYDRQKNIKEWEL